MINVVSKKISDLIHPDYNPRQITEKQMKDLKNSLSEFGAVDPAIINMATERENIIIGGNQRVRAAELLGWKEFPCVELVLTLDQEKQLNVRLNKNSGGWDWDLLANEFDEEDLINWGFSEEELGGEDFGEVEDVDDKPVGTKIVTCPYCDKDFDPKKASRG